MSEHTPLTEALVEAYRRGYRDRADESDYDPGHALDLAARTSTATADTGLRERVEALADQWDESSASGHPNCDIDADCVACAAAELRALPDATAAPTTDTGARDE